ncbi:hypothetical protein [Burkholderia sp. PU8-34]
MSVARPGSAQVAAARRIGGVPSPITSLTNGDSASEEHATADWLRVHRDDVLAGA